MRLTFKFKKAIDKHGNKILRPEIEAKLINGINSQKVVALLDSGADNCFIPKVLAERLGVNLPEKPTVTKGVGGAVSVYDCTVDLEIASGHEKALLRNVPVSVPAEDGETTWLLLLEEPFSLNISRFASGRQRTRLF